MIITDTLSVYHELQAELDKRLLNFEYDHYELFLDLHPTCEIDYTPGMLKIAVETFGSAVQEEEDEMPKSIN